MKGILTAGEYPPERKIRLFQSFVSVFTKSDEWT